MGQARNWNRLECAGTVLMFVEVSRQKTMSTAELHKAAEKSFMAHVMRLLNTHPELFKDCEVPKVGERSGLQMWTKQAEVRREMINNIAPIWEKIAKAGEPLPSGKQLDELVLKLKEKYFDFLSSEKTRLALQVTYHKLNIVNFVIIRSRRRTKQRGSVLASSPRRALRGRSPFHARLSRSP
jgi:hypothetical protein